MVAVPFVVALTPVATAAPTLPIRVPFLRLMLTLPLAAVAEMPVPVPAAPALSILPICVPAMVIVPLPVVLALMPAPVPPWNEIAPESTEIFCEFAALMIVA